MKSAPPATASAPSPAHLAPRFGAPRDAAIPWTEHVQVTMPDLARRAALEKTRGRLVLAAAGFGVLFLALLVKLADATILQPVQPRLEAARRPEPRRPPPGVKLAFAQVPGVAAGDRVPGGETVAPTPLADLLPRTQRAMVVDRNGEMLAMSLPTAGLYANPREMIDQADVAHKLKQILPRIDEEAVRARLSSEKQFVYIARQITPREQLAINRLGIPGISFAQTERRRYPLGRVAAQVLGGVDVDGHGIAGVERAFEERLHASPEPLRLSLDVRVQAVVREELIAAKDEFHAIGACGIVMDVRTAETLALVSLPDYDANAPAQASDEERRNRCLTGMYEPGSTFKLQTAAMALDAGAVHLWDSFDAAHPIHIGRFTITDFEGKHRMLTLPEVLAYSSNLGAAHIAMAAGAERQRAWLGRMGMFARVGIELPEAGMPIVPPVGNWKEAATMTIGFGHGIAVSPLHVVRGTAAIANGGMVLRPTILAVPSDAPQAGERVMQQSTSDLMRRLMRLVVTDGYGKTAEVPGYFVGGKTGTAEKVGRGGYKKHANVSAFMSVFPMNAPRYAVYMMLDEPQGNKETAGYSTAGWVSAPAAGKVIARIGPMLGLLPHIEDGAAIQASLAIPLQPGGHTASAPKKPAEPVAVAPTPAPAAPPRTLRDLRHEAMYRAPDNAVSPE